MNSLASTLSPSITSMIRMDHTHVLSIFHQYRISSSPSTKQALVRTACLGLEIHAQLEEEIFYPAVKKAIEEGEIIDEARQEHQQAKLLMAQLKNMQGQKNGAAEQFESKFAELVEAVQHHVEEEEGEMFPKAEESELDLAELGSEMAERKQELMQEMGAAETRAGSRSKSKAKAQPTRRTKSRSTTAGKSTGGKRARARAR